MKSNKPIKNLDEIILPFSFIPSVTLKGSVNAKSFHYPAGQFATLTFPEYEMLLNSDYAKYLTD